MHQQILEVEARLAAAEALSRGFAAEARQANAMVRVPYPSDAWNPPYKGSYLALQGGTVVTWPVVDH